jgi:short-subunit dehydrogenase
MTINMLHVTYTAKVLLNQMLERFDTKGKKSSILVTSSIIANLGTPTMATYSANKGFATMFTMGINPEVAGKIDVMAYEPGGLATKMLGRGPNPAVITPEDAAESAFQDIGKR